ncbi:MAG: hypothetical protein EOO61_15975 [Hymenobacter sp.]|nr:MAG: hypothetical protein EOO61_15975 [Hymenobacter sp.]
MKKAYYFFLIASGVWLALFQVIAWVLCIATGSIQQDVIGADKQEYLNYIVSLLTIIVSLFTVFASVKQLKLLNKTAKAK